MQLRKETFFYLIQFLVTRFNWIQGTDNSRCFRALGNSFVFIRHHVLKEYTCCITENCKDTQSSM